VAARYSTNAAATIVNAAVIDFEDRDFDTHGAVTTGASWKFTAPISGIYSVSSMIETSSTAEPTTGRYLALGIYKGGSVSRYLGEWTSQASATSTKVCSGATLIKLLAGEYIDIRLEFNLTNAHTLTAAGSVNHVSINRVGNY
jgi:hypothetical protein